MVRRRKIAIVGAGRIGGTLAHLASRRELGDVVLTDAEPDRARGKALDIAQSQPIDGLGGRLSGADARHALTGADVVVMTAGLPRQAHMSGREALLEINLPVVEGVARHVRRWCPGAFVIVVTNPVDAMTRVMHRVSGLPAGRVVGMAGVLDSARLRYFLAQEFGVSVRDVAALVLGGHGTTMVPLVRYATVAGIPVVDLVRRGWSTAERIRAIVRRTRDAGPEISALYPGASAFYAPAAAALTMAESYLGDQKRVLACAAWCDGPYRLAGLHIGVPVVIGAAGVERVVELPLRADERRMFAASARAVGELASAVDRLLGG